MQPADECVALLARLSAAVAAAASPGALDQIRGVLQHAVQAAAAPDRAWQGGARLQQARAAAPAPERALASAPARGCVSVAGVQVAAVILPPGLDGPAVYAAVATPELYYVPRWGHFAVRVGTVVVHGNVGETYPLGGARGQTRECRAARCTGAECPYYHCPAHHAPRGDVRNYRAGEWTYVPALAGGPRAGGPRLGSLSELPLDLELSTPADARAHMSRAAHELLCAVVLAQKHGRPV